MLSAGSLNSRITIQHLTNTGGLDEINQPEQEWGDLAQVWADIRHLTGSESIKAGNDASTVKASIRIRYRAGLTAGMRILHKTTAYEIKAVLPDERSRTYVDLLCEVVS